MLRNYFITGFRNLKNNRVYSLINVIGLGLGIACCFTHFAILKHENSFDSFHENSDKIYRIVEHYSGDNGIEYGAFLPNPLGHTLDEELTGIDVIPIQGPLTGTLKVKINNQLEVFKEEGNVIFSNANFLKYFNFPLTKGYNISALNEPNKIFLSEDIATKYFGKMNPVGQFIRYGDDLNLEVAGVLENVPYNTNIHFEILVSYPTLRAMYPDWLSNWGASWEGTAYVIKEREMTDKWVESQIRSITKTHMSQENFERNQYFLQPLREVHTDFTYVSAPGYIPPKEALLGSSITVILILLVSILNFINLSTSQAVKRSKEIGIRKTLGGRKMNIIIQFFIETIFIVTIASLIGLTLGQILMNLLNEAVAPFPFKVGYDMSVIGFTIALILFVTILSGIYPALVLTRFNPIRAIRNQVSLTSGSGSFSLRKALIIGQFTIANLLIAITIIAANQMDYIKTKDLGFNPENILKIHLSDQTKVPLDVAKEEFSKQSFVQKATLCMSPPQTGSSWNTRYNLTGEPSSDLLRTNMRFVDEAYLETFEIELVTGRNITNTLYPDSARFLSMKNL